ncbi:hypothetical protein DM02DRAFT_692711 [Periconia macrospinosa]|uniref:Uncharacterized protein n=1 Tax=Periconia macrospinosa TaxID=97972 RepID=A0A2V1D953_9PLEO|nr:hypothetical protein DM02DRAFT_692711 [Periconia macrospinosa]
MTKRKRQSSRPGNNRIPNSRSGNNANAPPGNSNSSSSRVITEDDLHIRFRNKTTPQERIKARVDLFLSLHPTGPNVRAHRDGIKTFAHSIRSGNYTDEYFYYFATNRSMYTRHWLATVKGSREAPQWLATAETVQEITQYIYSRYLAWNPRLTQEFPILVKYNDLDYLEAADHNNLARAIQSLPTPRDCDTDGRDGVGATGDGDATKDEGVADAAARDGGNTSTSHPASSNAPDQGPLRESLERLKSEASEDSFHETLGGSSQDISASLDTSGSLSKDTSGGLSEDTLASQDTSKGSKEAWTGSSQGLRGQTVAASQRRSTRRRTFYGNYFDPRSYQGY